MLFKIADLFIELPEESGLSPLLGEYATNEKRKPDIVIDAAKYRYDRWEGLSSNDVEYLESGIQFYCMLVSFGGMMLHASAIELDGRAYLFSGPSGMGKSTHASLWQREFPEARIFNDDKPALRRTDGRWFAYGTPWSGKNHININAKAPLAGICFLKRGTANAIRRLSPGEAVSHIIRQTMHSFNQAINLDLMLDCVEKLVTEIPIYEMHVLPDGAAARLAHDTMLKCAEDLNL